MLKQGKPELKFAWLGNLVASQMEKISPEDQDAAAWEVQSLMRRLTAKRTSSTTTSSQGITINHHHYY